MSPDVAVRVEGLGKDYEIGERTRGYGTLRESVSDAVASRFRRRRRHERSQERHPLVTALDDLSFTMATGETVGFIGHNGAGKSTLLKILARITEPTRGFAEVRGRVGALLEVGTGFHPELTGRENVYLNGAILGMRRREIDRKFDDIAAFAEIDRFLDTPVKRYSSGMKVRLAFAVASQIEPEVLVVDEVLAVGDVAFQRRCLDRIATLGNEGRTVLFVSHNMAVVQGLCRRGVVLQHGKLLTDGTMDDAIGTYLTTFELAATTPLAERTDRQGIGGVRATTISVRGLDGRAPTCGAPATIEVTVEPFEPVVTCEMTVYDQFGVPLTSFDSSNPGDNDDSNGEPGRFVCRIDEVLLAPGRYRVDLELLDPGRTNIWHDEVHAAAFFDVEQARVGGRPIVTSARGHAVIPHAWTTPRNR